MEFVVEYDANEMDIQEVVDSAVTCFYEEDVEGNEFNAIQGGLDTILKYEPLITIELSKHNLNNAIYNFDYFKKFLNDTKYKIYDDKLISFDIEALIDRINNLDNSHQTIGNYFLVKDSSYIYNRLLN